jgi:DNA-binding SARP family transcriptional activator
MSKTGAAALSIQLLGPFRVIVRGRPLADAQWPRRQARLLVKLLALAPAHQLHRQQLIEAICPDLDPESGAANLHKIIHLARRALEPALRAATESQFIVTQHQQVQLRSPGELSIDVEDFERGADRALRTGNVTDYEEALRLYVGDLLAEDRYADWCAERRDSLLAVREQLLIGLGRVYLTHHQHERAIKQFQTVLATAPANEDAHRQLMTLYVLTGRRSEALLQFRRCCEAVRSELDADPEEATLLLYRRIGAREIQALPQDQLGQPAAESVDTIAVLPFDNETDDSDLAYLAPGLAESLIKNLSQIPGLRVSAYSTVSRYKRRTVNPRKLGRELDVRALVTGRISRVSNTVIIATELVETADGSRLWGEEYRLRRTDILSIQQAISREISGKLRTHLSAEERRLIVKRYTADPEAYRLYLKGRFHWNKRTAAGLTKGIEYFGEAIRKDPSYALAYSGLADCYNLLSLYSMLPPKETMPQARAAAGKALQLDPSLAEAHASLAYTSLYYDWDWAAAEAEFQRALAINPNYATAHHWYHELLTALGRFEEQMAEILLAQELDPLSLIINTDVGWGLYYARSYDRAIEQLQRTLELDANFSVAHLILGLAYAQQDSLREATSSIERAIDLSGGTPSTLAVAALGYVHARSGRQADARSVLKRLETLPRAGYVSDYCRAMVLTGLNDSRSACERLERAIEERYDRLIYLNVEPIFDGLREDARFQRLVATIGLPEIRPRGKVLGRPASYRSRRWKEPAPADGPP